MHSAAVNPFTVVIPVYNAPEALDDCLASVAKTADPDTPVTVIDDASPDPAVAAVLDRWRGQMGLPVQTQVVYEQVTEMLMYKPPILSIPPARLHRH